MLRNPLVLALASVLIACNGVASATAAEITEETIETYYAAWSNHDVDAVMAYFTDDCVYEDVATGDLATGEKEIRAFAKKFLDGTPDVKVTPASITIGGARAAVEWIMSAGSGDEAWSVRGVAILVLRDGRISRATDYWDVEE
ncbi:MAG TPA: nuclear transport factor 2 family protein [Gammaproteobacteria bacterium]|jgi:steroid delta-isomerase-like uncharacterized protein|nr:nuclear transport factor 2 family protein [Gammaproteobacteria bacterium]